ncbi:hypothetical protein V5799_004110 [Amblyomma americanum]|uniref:Uncharacterized protein n=1 Tax=Amblyomma americanum TaxID=6943 RepID=A0AAQ4D718_AMBAM
MAHVARLKPYHVGRTDIVSRCAPTIASASHHVSAKDGIFTSAMATVPCRWDLKGNESLQSRRLHTTDLEPVFSAYAIKTFLAACTCFILHLCALSSSSSVYFP